MTPYDIAVGELGITEYPTNSNNVKYNTWYYGREVSGGSYPWCMTFVEWCYSEAGYNLPKTAYCPYLYSKFRNCVTTAPVKGDIVLYDWTGIGVYGHTGIVESSDGVNVTAIEGNTSSGESGSQDNGGGVFRRVRNIAATRAAFLHIFDFVPESEEKDMTRDEILRELGDVWIERYDQLPDWAKPDMRELLDGGVINGGTDADVDGDDINMFLSDIKSVIISKRLLKGRI